MKRGLDAASILLPFSKKIADAGFSAVGRYLKSLSKAEIAALHAAGLDVWLIFEYGAKRSFDGAAAGAVDGKRAAAQADALGAPTDAALFATADTDVVQERLPVVSDYLIQFAAAIAPRRLGIYADDDVLSRPWTPGVVLWLAGAGGWDSVPGVTSAWAMKQGPTIKANQAKPWSGESWPALPFDYDPDLIARDDIGAWKAETGTIPGPHIVIPSALDMQIQLKAEGLYKGALDGDKPDGWGPLSQAALAAHYKR